MKIVIPMAGMGIRFTDAGYIFPKPLIDVLGKPMVERTIDNIGIDGHYIFIVQEQHVIRYGLEYSLKKIIPDCTVISIDYITNGQASSILLAEEFINCDEDLLTANCDQLVDWDIEAFLSLAENCDGVIPTFEGSSTKWSYAKLDANGIVVQTAEKNPISNHATVGMYHWSRGSDFVTCAKQMIEKNLRVNLHFVLWTWRECMEWERQGS
jgi:dTDP-glucose pyrophosphorylase